MPCLAEGNAEFHKALVDPDWECGYALCSTDLTAKPRPWILSSDGQFPLPEECIATSFFSQRAIISESSFTLICNAYAASLELRIATSAVLLSGLVVVLLSSSVLTFQAPMKTFFSFFLLQCSTARDESVNRGKLTRLSEGKHLKWAPFQAPSLLLS